jgi:hypothetical protein
MFDREERLETFRYADNKQEAELIDALVNNDVEALKEAVKNGSDLRCKNDYVLRLGTFNNYKEIIKYALSVTTFDARNMKTAKRIAKERNYFELLNIFKNAERINKLKKIEET